MNHPARTQAAIPVLLLALLVTGNPFSLPAQWPQFRGPGAAGLGTDPRLPDRWSATENVAWKSDLPGRSWSSPIVSHGRIFLTTVINSGPSEEPKKGLYFGGDRPEPPKSAHEWQVRCLDLATGQPIWSRTVHQGPPRGSIHLKSSYGAETPATDGERVFVVFGGMGIHALTTNGLPVWSRPLEPRKTRYGWGTAASPIVHGERLFVVDDNEESSELLALDTRTGRELWRTPRDEKSNWATPFVWEHDGRTELITAGSRAVRSQDLDGRPLWSLRGMSTIAIPTPLTGSGLLFVTSGYVGDKLRPIYALRPGATGDLTLAADTTTNAFVAWSNPVAGPYNPSPLYHDGRLYVLYDRGLVSCFDAATGHTLYDRERLPEGFAFTASPWTARNRIFCLNENGACYVLRAGDKFEVLHINKLADDDMCMATPALAGDRLLIRTSARLYCLLSPRDPREAASPSAASQARTSPGWSQFRGPNAQGLSPESRIPTHFGPATNVLWKTPVPPGHSSPIYQGSSIFLTGHESNQPNALITLGIDRITGRISWQQTVHTESKSGFHALNNAAASTPAADPEHVYAYFGTYGLLCYDHTGRRLWERRLETPKSKYGMATSPVLYRNTLLLLQDGDGGNSRLLAVHKDTGDTVWEQPRPLFKAGWSTPVLFTHDHTEDLMVLGAKRLTAYDPATGEERWWAGGFPDETVGVPVLADGLIIAGAAALGGRGDDQIDAAATWKMTTDEFDRNHDNQIQREEMTRGFGFIQRPELPKDNPGYAMPVRDMDAVLRMFDHDKNNVITESEWNKSMAGFAAFSQPYLAAFRPGAKLDARPDHLAWETRRGIPETPSALCVGGRLHLMRDGGLLTTLDAATGRELFRERLGAPGQYVASPIAAGNRIVVASVPGIVTVLNPGDSLDIAARNDLGEEIYATPAPATNALYVRTTGHLYAFGER